MSKPNTDLVANIIPGDATFKGTDDPAPWHENNDKIRREAELIPKLPGIEVLLA